MADQSSSTTENKSLDGWILARKKAVVGTVLFLALALRVWHLLEIRANDPFFHLPSVDPRVYHDWATQIASGHWIGEGVFFQSPLYPYFLGLIYAIAGPSFLAARVVQLLIGTLNCLLVYLIGRRVFGPRTALLAALFAALYSLSIFYDGILLITAIQTPLNLATVLLLLRAEESWRKRDWLLAGVFLGLSALARPNVLLFPGFIIAWLYLGFRGRRSLGQVTAAGAAFCVGIGLMVFPVTARNYLVGGDRVLVSAHGGLNFYIGNGPDANGVFNVPRIFPTTFADHPHQQADAYRVVAERDLGRDLLPSEVSTYWNARTWEHIRQNPGTWVKVLATKLGLVFNHFEFGNSRNYYDSRRFSAVLSLPLLTFGVLGPLALLGMVVAAPRFREAFYLYAMVGTYVLALTLYFVLSHYRMPVIPFFWLFAAYGVVWIIDRGKAVRESGRSGKVRLFAAGIGLAAAVGLVHMDLGPAEGWRDSFMVHFNLGNRYRQLGRRDQAVAEYRRAIELRPDYISAHNNLGLLCEEDPADRQCAIDAWQSVLELARQSRNAVHYERAQRHLERLRSP